MSSSERLNQALNVAPIVPVLTVPDASQAAELAHSFKRGGLTVLEITLRTEAAADAIAEMKRAEPDMVVGAGTIRNEDDLKAAMDAGSDFLVSPGLSPSLIDATRGLSVPLLPGIATPSEAMSAYEAGFETLKLFPAEVVGGAPMLKAMSGPLPHLKFMPTGGLNPDNLKIYASLPNVVAIGGTWLAKPDHILAGDWDGIEKRSREALDLIASE